MEPRNPRLISSGQRSEVHLVSIGGVLGVRKTFRPGYERFLKREIFARSELSQEFPQIPPLLDFSDSHVTSPFYEDKLRFSRSGLRLLPLEHVRKVLIFLEALLERGFCLLDAHPENFLVDAKGETIFYDFEFLHRYQSAKPSSFQKSWDLVGPPAEWRGDRPAGGCTTWRGSVRISV